MKLVTYFKLVPPLYATNYTLPPTPTPNPVPVPPPVPSYLSSSTIAYAHPTCMRFSLAYF